MCRLVAATTNLAGERKNVFLLHFVRCMMLLTPGGEPIHFNIFFVYCLIVVISCRMCDVINTTCSQIGRKQGRRQRGAHVGILTYFACLCTVGH